MTDAELVRQIIQSVEAVEFDENVNLDRITGPLEALASRLESGVIVPREHWSHPEWCEAYGWADPFCSKAMERCDCYLQAQEEQG